MKKKVSLGFVIAALITAIALAVAVAEISRSTISANWSGEVPELSEEVGEDLVDVTAELRTMRSVLADAPDDMLVSVDGSNLIPGLVRGKRKVLTSMEKFNHPGITFPDDLEQQDSFALELTYDCLAGGGYQLVKEEAVDGYMLRLYNFDPEYEILSEYNVSYLDGDGYWRSVRSALSRTQNNEFNFELMDGEEHTVEAVDIPGFDHAIYVVRGLNKKLMAIRTLKEPVTIVNRPNPFIQINEKESTEYRYELIEVNGYTLEECLALLNPGT